ncbi:MAG: phage head closure protein [Xanthobacteraceae bacterium]
MSTSHFIPAGKLTRSIQIQRATTTTDEAGAPVKTWTSLAKIKAELAEQATKDERVADLGQISREAVLFRTRWLNDVTLSDQLVYAGNAYQITKLAEIGIKRGLEITAKRFT